MPRPIRWCQIRLTITRDVSGFDSEVRRYNQMIEQRLQQGLHSTLVIFLNSHGFADKSGEGTFGIYNKLKMVDSVNAFLLLNPNVVSTRACRVRFILSMCHAGAFAKDIMTQFQSREHDIVVYAAEGVSAGAAIEAVALTGIAGAAGSIPALLQAVRVQPARALRAE